MSIKLNAQEKEILLDMLEADVTLDVVSGTYQQIARGIITKLKQDNESN